MSAYAPTNPWIDEFSAAYRDLLRFLRRRTGNEDIARELLQDTWLRVADGAAAAPQTSDHARAYLFTVAERLAIDHLRRQRFWDDELAPRLHAPGAAQAPDVAEAHAYGRALRDVEAALAAMPERMRAIFVAHRLDGVPHAELARRWGVSAKTVEREVSAAMDQAQRALARGEAEAAPRQGRRKALGALLGVGGLACGGGLAWRSWQQDRPEWQTALALPAGQQGRLALPDGSQLRLDADSAVEARYHADRRELRLLRGAAFFDVAHDPARPFVVQAGTARITVLGTRFAVELAPAGRVDVAVEQGRVAMAGRRDAPALHLRAGEAARVEPDGPADRRAAPAGDVAPWREGWLEFERLPLGEVAARLNRYRPQALIRVAPEAAELPVLARVQIARSQAWLQQGLPAALPVRVQASADGRVEITLRR